MSVKTKPLRASKMSRNLSRHNGVSCDACGKSSFPGKRYKCLTCYDFDLCAECYDSGEAGTSRHSISHPMQCIITRVESELYYGGETRTEVMDAPQSFTCPLCAQIGFSEAELREHVSKKHAESAVLQEVICPVCAAYPNGDPNHLTDDLATHLTVEHRALEQDSQSTVAQSRVRRLIGRRRAGLDRYIGALSREMGQDSIDPIADMLTQLTGQSGGSSGGGASGRRDYYPPHIQQLLDQDRHTYSYDHRSSPLRRPVYRKVMVGGGVPPSAYDGNPLPVNLQAHLLDTPLSERGVGLGGVDRLSSRVELLAETTAKKESEKSSSSTSEKENPFLLANYSLPEPSGSELEEKRRHMSRFVQELLLSTLTSSSSSSDSSTGNSDEESDNHKQSL